jgi:ABC-type lipoprotein export system ATPase subunit
VLTTNAESHLGPDVATFIVAECVDVGRSFGVGATAVRALRCVSCRIPSSARIALSGPSGSGKSTLLHVLAGIDAPTVGTVSWPALPVEGGTHPRGVGLVFQGPSLLPSFDVVENVALPMLFAGCAERTARHRALDALDLVGMRALAGKLPQELSGGQSQRVAVARVLASRPALILADEPTAALDHDNADKVITALVDTATSLGAALMISTHDPLVAARLDDRWVMSDGNLDVSPRLNSP